MIAILGAGPHGHAVADLIGGELFDDCLPGYESCKIGAERSESYYIGAVWPNVRRRIDGIAQAAGNYRGNAEIVFPGARVSYGARLGRQVHILYNAVISHGCTLGDFVTVCSGAVLCGEVTVADDVFIGANATVIHGGITIGHGAVIGAGAVVTRNVEPGETVAGVPARCLT